MAEKNRQRFNILQNLVGKKANGCKTKKHEYHEVFKIDAILVEFVLMFFLRRTLIQR